MPKRRGPPSHGRRRPDRQRQSDRTRVRSDAAVRSQARRRHWRAMSACRRGSSLAGGKLTFDDLDSSIAGSRLRGRIALTLGDERNVEGEVGLDTLDLAPAFALAIGSCRARRGGAARCRAAEGLARPCHVSGVARLASGRRRVAPGERDGRQSDGQSLTFDEIKGVIGGGEATANIDARQTSDGIALNARVQLTGRGWRGAALSAACDAGGPRLDADDAGEPGPQHIGADRGAVRKRRRDAGIRRHRRARSARVRCRDPRQRRRAGDRRHPAAADRRAGVVGRRVVGRLGTNPFTIRDGRLRVGATTLDADGARAVVSGGYDIPADQADIRATLASTSVGAAASRPEIQLFAAGSPDALNRTIDVAALSSWLAVRAIDRETRRLDSIERGERPPAATPASIPPDAIGADSRCGPIRSIASRCAKSGPRPAPAAVETQGKPAASAGDAPDTRPARGQPAGRAAAAADRSPAGPQCGAAAEAAGAPGADAAPRQSATAVFLTCGRAMPHGCARARAWLTVPLRGKTAQGSSCRPQFPVFSPPGDRYCRVRSLPGLRCAGGFFSWPLWWSAPCS